MCGNLPAPEMAQQLWSTEEVNKLNQMRRVLGDKLTRRRQLPDVVGDRRLLRFLRGHKTVEKASEMFTKFLKWRDENDVDSIRDDILYGGMTSQYDLPAARKIFSLLPQTMMSADALDLKGNPVALESFSFQPDVVLRDIPKPEYVTFMIYTLEYKILMLDQLAAEREQDFLRQQRQMGRAVTSPYGIMVQSNIIRDLHGFGMSHVGGDGQTVMKWILEIAADNYPELLYKSHMVNVPWIFNSIWWLVKNILDPNTIKKISITGTDYMKVLQKDIPLSSIPISLGGKCVPREDLFRFDTSPSGPFYYPGCESEINYLGRREHRLRVNNNASSSISQQQNMPLLSGSSSQDVDVLRSFKSNASTTSEKSRLSNGFYPIEPQVPRNGMISTTSTEAVLLTALGSRQVKVSHILKMGDPSRNRDADIMESFVEGRRRRARDRVSIPKDDLEGMKPQRFCDRQNCSIQ